MHLHAVVPISGSAIHEAVATCVKHGVAAVRAGQAAAVAPVPVMVACRTERAGPHACRDLQASGWGGLSSDLGDAAGDML